MNDNLYAITIARDYLDRFEELEEQVLQLQEVYPYHDWKPMMDELALRISLAELWFDISEALYRRRTDDFND